MTSNDPLAFPSINAKSSDNLGLTMRDYFAAQAMQGFASVPEMTWNGGLDGMAVQAYRWADAMMKARGE